jgi:hypothetical protein
MRATRLVWTIVGLTVATAIGTAAFAWRPRAAPPAPAAAGSLPPVRVERTLVLAEEEVVERPVRTLRAQARPGPGTGAPPVMSRATRIPPVTSRARRILFGSGRHRPEPFPRVSEADSGPR